jgi:hypothetical protein
LSFRDVFCGHFYITTSGTRCAMDFVVHSFLPQNFMMPSDITRSYHEAAMGQILVRNIEDMTFKIEVHFGCVMPPR